MKAVIQRVTEANVSVDNAQLGRIGRGLVVLLGITHTDTAEKIPLLVKKIVDVGYFEDAEGRLGKTLRDVGGAVLLVSQFTVYGKADKGRKISFTDAAPGAVAEPLYQLCAQALRDAGITVATGMFGAMMQVSLTNDGPVTMIIDV